MRALSAALPADIPLEEIEARLGAAWIDAETHRQFLAELLDDDTAYVEHAGGSTWAVRGNRSSVAATSQWGTERLPATKIAELLMQQKPIRVTDPTGDGDKRVVNPTETAAAIDKGEQLQNASASGCGKTPTAPPGCTPSTTAGSTRSRCATTRRPAIVSLSPGLAKTFTPRQHQRAGVARMLAEPTVGLFPRGRRRQDRDDGDRHDGAAAPRDGHQARRRRSKPHARAVHPECLSSTPRPGYSPPQPDLTHDRRRDFVARIASHDWDAVVMTRGAFQRLSLKPESVAAYVDRQVDDLEDQLAAPAPPAAA